MTPVEHVKKWLEFQTEQRSTYADPVKISIGICAISLDRIASAQERLVELHEAFEKRSLDRYNRENMLMDDYYKSVKSVSQDVFPADEGESHD